MRMQLDSQGKAALAQGGSDPALRVLLVSDFYPPLIGGAARSTQLLASALARRGHDISVATARQDGASPRETEDRVEVRRHNGLTFRLGHLSANKYRNITPPYPDPELVWRLRRHIRDFQPDLVHAQGWMVYSCAVALFGIGTPLLVSARDWGNLCAKISFVYEGGACEGPSPIKCLGCASRHYGPVKGSVAVAGVLGGRHLIRARLSGLHSCGTHVGELMVRYLLRREPARSVPHAVLPDFRGPEEGHADEAILQQLPREPFVLFVGALRKIKGLEPLLAAYEKLRDPPPLVVIGTRAPDTPAAFPAGVTVLYDVPHATVMAAWDRALFGVAPSILPEPLGNVVHEAMSRGKAVIGTTPGGHRDMIGDEECGLLVPLNDAEALAGAMRRLIEDVPLRTRHERAAPARAEAFTEDAVIPRFECLYREVLAASASGSPGQPSAGRPIERRSVQRSSHSGLRSPSRRSGFSRPARRVGVR